MLKADRITKRFGDLLALDDVTIDFLPGEIHAVLGENGAGKTTLMNVLAGFLSPSSGHVSLDGIPLPAGQPHKTRKAGVAMVHQHFRLVPEFTVEENLALANIDRLTERLNVHDRASDCLRMGRELGWPLDAKAKVRNLPVGVQQRIEILKALSGNAKIVIFDEPTAVLAPQEVEDLFGVMRQLKHEGKAVILIAHKLAEVMKIADRVTVLRHGRFVASANIQDVKESVLADWMVGEMPEFKREPVRSGATALKVSGLRVKGDRGEEAVRSVDFEIRRGEIVGIGGVDGNGQVELAEALALVRKPSSGRLQWEDGDLGALPLHLAYIPQDRQLDGLALPMSVRDNLLIEGQNRAEMRQGPILKSSRLRQWSEDIVKRFDVRASSLDEPAESLSGGNQQKIVVGRNLDQTPDLLVAVNPTRGLDVKAAQFVHSQIARARDEGAAVALFSTDLDELALLADRTLFITSGRLTEGGAVAMVGGL